MAIDGWQKIRSLGEGGQGRAFLVNSDRFPDEYFVLKCLKNANRIMRFKVEVDACSRLDHPNILRVLEYSTDDPKGAYMVTEYCEGGTLAEANLTKWTALEKIDLFSLICEAVACAHENGITHRDLKPENIFLRKDGSPVVGDFGICFFDNGERFTVTEEAVGPRLFIAPELESGRADCVTPAADVYSLGKVLYWLWAGRVFARERHQDEEYDLTKIAPSAETFLLYELLNGMIAEEPTKRFQDAGKVLKELQLLRERIVTRAHPLNLSAPLHCNFCGVGRYVRVVDTLRDLEDASKMGLEKYSGQEWLVFVCNYCSNVQFFRTDYLQILRPFRPNRGNPWVEG